MPNAPEPDRGGTPNRPGSDPQEYRSDPGGERSAEPGQDETEGYPLVPHDSETETVVINKPDPGADPEPNLEGQQRERRFTAPGFDAKETAVIATPAEPATEVFATLPGGAGAPGQPGMPSKAVVPQSIPPRDGFGS